jgi:5-methylcytosine-specific restriction endonuclease McrA
MKKHKKIYINFFDYCEQDFIPCEVCGSQAVDVHHIDPRRMGGSKHKDYIENLMGLCRSCHNKAEADDTINEEYRDIHLRYLTKHGYDGNRED